MEITSSEAREARKIIGYNRSSITALETFQKASPTKDRARMIEHKKLTIKALDFMLCYANVIPDEDAEAPR